MKERKNLKKSVKLNVNFLLFVKEVKNMKDLNLIEKKYNEIVELKFSNVSKVLSRIERDELKEIKREKLKELNVNDDEYKKVIEMLNKNRKKRNYIEV